MTVRTFVNQVIAEQQLEDTRQRRESAEMFGVRGQDMRATVERRWDEFRQTMAEHRRKMEQMRRDFEEQRRRLEEEQRRMEQEMRAAQQAAVGGVADLEREMAAQRAQMEAEMRGMEQQLAQQQASMQAEMQSQMQQAQALLEAAQAKMAAAQTEMERRAAEMEIALAQEHAKLVEQMVAAIQRQEEAKAAMASQLGGPDEIEEQMNLAEEQLRIKAQELLPMPEALQNEQAEQRQDLDALVAGAASAVGRAQRRIAGEVQSLRPFSESTALELGGLKERLAQLAAQRLEQPEIEDRLAEGIEMVPKVVGQEVHRLAMENLGQLTAVREALQGGEQGILGVVGEAARRLEVQLDARGTIEPLAGAWVDLKEQEESGFFSKIAASQDALIGGLANEARLAVEARLEGRLEIHDLKHALINEGPEGLPQFIGAEGAEWLAEATHHLASRDAGSSVLSEDQLVTNVSGDASIADRIAQIQSGAGFVALAHQAGMAGASAGPLPADPMWLEFTVNTIASKTLEGDEGATRRMNECWQAAMDATGVSDPEDAGEARALDPDAFAEVLRGAGFDLEGMDPAQLAQAHAYVGSAETAGEQAVRLRKALYNLEVIAQDRVPEFSAEEQERIDTLIRTIPGAPLTQEELRALGSGITEMPPQGYWNDGVVGVGMDPAIFHDQYQQITGPLVRNSLGITGSTDMQGAPPGELAPEQLAALIRDAGVPIERIDPQQLMAATNYINTGASGAVAEFSRGPSDTMALMEERIGLCLKQFLYLDQHGAPELDPQLAREVAWSVGRVPGHAFENVEPSELKDTMQQLGAAANSPGQHELKVGKHNVTMEIGENNQVLKTESNKPGFFSKLGGILKKALPVVSTVLMFTGVGSVVGVALKAASMAMAAYDAAKSAIKGDWLGMITSAAGAVAAGISGAAGSIADKVRNIASMTSRVGRGIQSIQQGGLGGLVNGIASVAGGVSDGIGNKLGNFGTSLESFARYAQPAGTGFSAAQAAAQGNWAAAFNAGVGSVAAVNSLGDGDLLGLGERGMDILQASGRGVSMADAIARGDYNSAAANALALAADLRSAAAGRPENDDTRVDMLRRAGEAALAGNNLANAIDSGNFADISAALNQLSQVQSSLEDRRELAADAQDVLDAIQARAIASARTRGQLAGLSDEEASRNAATALGAGDALRVYDEASAALEAAIARGDTRAALEAERNLDKATAQAAQLADLIWQITPGNVPVETLPIELQLAQLHLPEAEVAVPAAAYDPTIPQGNVLALGSRGEDVRALQQRLNEALGLTLDEDGIFGPQTAAALQAFQQLAGVSVDGVYGPETGAYLGVDVLEREDAVAAPEAPAGDGRLPSVIIGGSDIPLADAVQRLQSVYGDDPNRLQTLIGRARNEAGTPVDAANAQAELAAIFGGVPDTLSLSQLDRYFAAQNSVQNHPYGLPGALVQALMNPLLGAGYETLKGIEQAGYLQGLSAWASGRPEEFDPSADNASPASVLNVDANNQGTFAGLMAAYQQEVLAGLDFDQIDRDALFFAALEEANRWSPDERAAFDAFIEQQIAGNAELEANQAYLRHFREQDMNEVKRQQLDELQKANDQLRFALLDPNASEGQRQAARYAALQARTRFEDDTNLGYAKPASSFDPGNPPSPEGFTLGPFGVVVHGEYQHPAQVDAVRAHEQVHVDQWRSTDIVTQPTWELERQGFAAEIPILEQALNEPALTQNERAALEAQLEMARNLSTVQGAKEYQNAKPGVIDFWMRYFGLD